MELIDLVMELKQAYYKKKFPQLSEKQIDRKIYQEILKRKNIEWNYPED